MCEVGQPFAPIKGNYLFVGEVICGMMKGSNQIGDNFPQGLFFFFSDASFDCHRFVLNYAAVMVTL